MDRIWITIVFVFLFFQTSLSSGQQLEFVPGAEKFSGGIRHLKEKETRQFLIRTLNRFLRSGKDRFAPEDEGGNWIHLSLTRHCLLNHGWVLVSGVFRGPGFEGMDVVFLVNSPRKIIQVLYAEESGSAILARFLLDPGGNRIFLGRDWYYSNSCFSCFNIEADGASRNERFEDASRLAHVLVRRIIKANSGGETRLFLNEQTGRFGFCVHEWDENTPVKCEVEFDESTGQLLIQTGSKEIRRVNFPAFSQPLPSPVRKKF